MLEQLFGSKTRTKLLKLFLLNDDRPYFIRELTRIIDTQINSVRRELQNLLDCKIIKVVPSNSSGNGKSIQAAGIAGKKGQTVKLKLQSEDKQPKKYFAANTDFILFKELRMLFFKSPLLFQSALVEELKNIEGIDYAVITGFFLDDSTTPVDLLIVGSPNKTRLTKLLSRFETNLEREINYSAMTSEEFLYRKSLTDRFLFRILEGKKIVVVDKLTP